MNRILVLNIFLTGIDDFSCFSWVFFLKHKSDTSITLRTFYNHVERQFGKTIKQIHSDNGGKYINNELKHFFLTHRVIHKVIPPYSAESNDIAEPCNQINNMTAHSITIGDLDFPCLSAEAVNMGVYLENRLPHKYLLSSTTSFQCFHSKRPTISHLKPFESKCNVHIREEPHFSGGPHGPCAHDVIIS
jgi:transposase InsO family protein